MMLAAAASPDSHRDALVPDSDGIGTSVTPTWRMTMTLTWRTVTFAISALMALSLAACSTGSSSSSAAASAGASNGLTGKTATRSPGRTPRGAITLRSFRAGDRRHDDDLFVAQLTAAASWKIDGSTLTITDADAATMQFD
jgi:hypothetical protein